MPARRPLAHRTIHLPLPHRREARWRRATESSGIAALAPRAARGAAFADFDNGGFVDIVVANNGGPPAILHDDAGRENHFVSFRGQKQPRRRGCPHQDHSRRPLANPRNWRRRQLSFAKRSPRQLRLGKIHRWGARNLVAQRRETILAQCRRRQGLPHHRSLRLAPLQKTDGR